MDQFSAQYGQFFHQETDQQITGFFINTQRRLLKEHQAQQQQLSEMAKKVSDLLAETRSHQNEVKTQAVNKQGLKAKFKAILNSYIQQRDALNTLTQGRAVKDLQEHARSQVDNL